MYTLLKKEIEDYYRCMDDNGGKVVDEAHHKKLSEIADLVFDDMNKFYRENPDTPSVLLKSRMHTLIARHFDPVIFPESPFFFEMGIHESSSWGVCRLSSAPSLWLMQTKKEEIDKKYPICVDLYNEVAQFCCGGPERAGICTESAEFDPDHHTLGYTHLFSVGINGLIAETKNKMKNLEEGSDQYYFCKAVEESAAALIHIAAKFADKAEKMLAECKNERQCKYLRMIAKTAKKIPAAPPETFYEGLAMLLFTREAIAAIENIGISQLGHVDRLLGDLYERDLDAGRITEEEARELIGIWMLYTDIKFNLEKNEWPETSTCIQLGGCDAEGRPVYNHVTEMFIAVHHELRLVNPKLNCRFSQKSPDAYLKMIGKAILDKHNNFALCNDDVLIPGLVKSGVAEKDAAMYVNGGCQETMIEGFGHTEGANIYISLPRLLDLFLRNDKGREWIKPIESADSFEEFYDQFFSAVKAFTDMIDERRKYCLGFRKEALPAPLYSATQTGCIENGMDYVFGGAKYNFTTVCMLGLATTVDSLYAIKNLVYDKKVLKLEQLIRILADNWEGHEEMRQIAASLPKYGQNNHDANMLANKVVGDLSLMYSQKTNERGGKFLLSMFVYYFYKKDFAEYVRAMPNGRKNGDLISPGISPGQMTEVRDVTEPLKTIEKVDFKALGGGNAVLDLQLPITRNLNEDIFAALIRTCGKYGCPTVQPNVISVAELIDAKNNPQKHKNLIVRICGLSAYFVALAPDVQDEIISRNIYNM